MSMKMGTKKTEILLDTGTNELEILEFTIANHSFGINVAKVRELMQYKPIQTMPRSHPCIEGIFKPRDLVLTVINLAEYLSLPTSGSPERDIFIIAGFNNMNIAFHVHTVESIHRVSWQAIEKPDAAIFGGSDGTVTGIAKIKDKMISIIDFEKIVTELAPEAGLKVSEIAQMGDRAKTDVPILIAEDSMVLNKMILDALSAAGFTHSMTTTNGEEAWDLINGYKQKGDIFDHVRLLITDIEMPKMDGMHLTKLIKDDPVLKKLPVIIFSSLIDESMRRKGEEIGADAQLTKPEIGNLIHVIDRVLQRQKE